MEDNENIRTELASCFRDHGYETMGFGGDPGGGIPEEVSPEENSPAEAVLAGNILSWKPDMILLDINLGNLDGFLLCRLIRKQSDVPVIFVTGRDGEWDELRGIRLGGDDFVRKPYSLPVLLARVERIFQRSRAGSGELRVGEAVLSLARGQISFGGRTLELSPKEFQMLYFLCLNQGRTVSRDALVEYLWENKMYVDENVLNVNLSRLRRRLADVGLQDLIRTVPRQGYRVEAVNES